MNTYRKTGKILAVLLLVVFFFAATQPTTAHSPYGSKRTAVQNHLENLAVIVIPGWHTSFLHVKSPLIGTTWTTRLESFISKSVSLSTELDVSSNRYSCFFITPTINAP